VVIPLSLQRRVESLVQDHLDRAMLRSGKENDNSMSEDLKEIQPDANQGSLIDEHVMEKILHRKSFRMKNLQRTWQVLLYY
jgi:ATP-dependent RNA helicase DHX36